MKNPFKRLKVRFFQKVCLWELSQYNTLPRIDFPSTECIAEIVQRLQYFKELHVDEMCLFHQPISVYHTSLSHLTQEVKDAQSCLNNVGAYKGSAQPLTKTEIGKWAKGEHGKSILELTQELMKELATLSEILARHQETYSNGDKRYFYRIAHDTLAWLSAIYK